MGYYQISRYKSTIIRDANARNGNLRTQTEDEEDHDRKDDTTHNFFVFEDVN